VSQVSGRLSHHFAITDRLSGRLAHRFAITNHLSGRFSHRFRILEEASGGVPGPGDFSMTKVLAATCTITRAPGGTKTIPADSLTITRSKSAPLTWSLTIFDPDGTYNPDNTASPWHEWLRPEFQPKGAPTKTIKISVHADYPGSNWSGTRDYTDLILLSRDYEASPEGGYTLTLSGTDYSQVLFRDYQTMQTIQSSTAKAIIEGILTEFGVGSRILNVSPDYPVAQFDFQRDRPINRIQTLLNEWGAFWRMEGRTFIAWTPSVKSYGDWTYKDADNIYTLRLNEQVMTLFNKVTACRVSKNADLAYSQEGGSEGRMHGSFSAPCWNPRMSVVFAFGCAVRLVDYFIGSTYVGQGFSVNGRADNVYFTVDPTDPDIAPRWKVEVRGTPESQMGSGVDLNATYTYEDTDSIALYGELPAPDIESNFTATVPMAQIKAEAFMREQGRMKRTITLEAPINPWLELDETVKVDERVSRYAGYFNVERITTSITGFEGNDSLEVVEYES
jgi:hypothetical protein